jgi:hypothetical protein
MLMHVMFVYVIINLSLVFHVYDVMLLSTPSTTDGSLLKDHCSLPLPLPLPLPLSLSL